MQFVAPPFYSTLKVIKYLVKLSRTGRIRKYMTGLSNSDTQSFFRQLFGSFPMSSWGSQFSEGDHGWNRTLFWDSSYSVCPACKGTDLSHVDYTAGCRHNGDGYGTTVYTCKGCGWVTSFHYDESSSPYYYETRTFSITPPVHVPTPDRVIGTYIKEHKWNPMRLTHTDDQLRAIMLADGYTDAIITAYFAEQQPNIFNRSYGSLRQYLSASTSPSTAPSTTATSDAAPNADQAALESREVENMSAGQRGGEERSSVDVGNCRVCVVS